MLVRARNDSPLNSNRWISLFIVVPWCCVVRLGGLFDLGDFSGLEAECFVESYEHEWCAFVGFLALARTLSLTPIAPAKASSVLRPLICLE